ncbi:MAG: hypothetical protein K2L62_01490 [Muribaculaceae bacterium]|nr:hypothetical protein [Muribaculaceae bacterium]
MDEKLSSALGGLKDLAAKAHLDDKLGDVGEKIKEAVSEIDIKEAAGDIVEKFKSGGIGEALHEVGDKIKEVAGKAMNESLRDNPGAAIDNADGDKVNAGLVDERTRTLNSNPRNGDMEV